MMKSLSAVLIAIVLSVAMPAPLSAKAPTAKITITGRGLTRTVEVTDPRALSSFGPWNGRFIDWSRRIVTEPRGGLEPYEVSFYVKFGDDDVRMVYVVYYYPETSAEHGYIYIPGKGDKWYSLNTSTISHGGKDGKWHYASSEWEARIKPLITGAEPSAHPTAGR
jgi:hypothetical protein